MAPERTHRRRFGLVAAAVGGLLAGGVFSLMGVPGVADAFWIATTLIGVGPAAWWVWERLRHRQLGADVVALAALLGTLAVGEYLAGAVITVMLATGRALEAVATARSRRDLHALVSRAPTEVQRYDGDTLATVPVAAVQPGDLLLVRPGDIVPVDGVVRKGVAVLDESALTGEARPVERPSPDLIRSGAVNAGSPFDLRATTTAADSTYAAIVRLVEGAEASSAPFVRLADRYAAVFLSMSFAVAGLSWLVSGDPRRAVAVLVVATPCPLILAVPVAMVAGLSRAARRGVIVKGGGALERLAQGRVLLFDKTGTLTAGRPALSEVVVGATVSADELVRYAASLDQVSSHVLAAATVRAASERGRTLHLPTSVEEVPGRGVRGQVDGHDVALGKAEWVAALEGAPWVRAARRRADLDGSSVVFVAIDGEPAGALLFEDPIRLDAARTIRALRRRGIQRVVMVTGDRADVAETVGAVIGVDEVLAERSPADKVDAVALEARWGPTIMVGDGINDAPALAIADVGVALGARGASASSAAADVVIAVDRLDRLGDAVAIARHTRTIAAQSGVAGVGLSVVAMGFAAAGLIAPAWGALLQELIDVAVIINALRALRGGDVARPRPASDTELTRHFGAEHAVLRPELDQIRSAADGLAGPDLRAAIGRANDVHRFLVDELLPHERAEDAKLYPVIDRALGGEEPMASMRREHVEIAHQVRRLGRLLEGIDAEHPEGEDVLELRRLLYGLHAILRLHFAQEDERYFSFADDVVLSIDSPSGG